MQLIQPDQFLSDYRGNQSIYLNENLRRELAQSRWKRNWTKCERKIAQFSHYAKNSFVHRLCNPKPVRGR